MTELVKYDAACRALAEACNVDEVKQILDVSIAVKAYAKQAKNKDLEADAFEIRKRAELRLGEMMEQQPKQDGGIARKLSTRVIEKPEQAPITLADAGIDKNLANRAREAVALKKAGLFDDMVSEGRAEVKKAAEKRTAAQVNRKNKHQNIAAKAATASLEYLGPFPLIYADPPWKWGHFGEPDQENEKGKEKTPDQHYPTLTYDEIKDFRIQGKPIKEIAHKDAALFLWCTSANIVFALEVMEAWGFTYKAHAMWDKERPGLGLVFRNQHEVLLYGTRGAMPGPQHQPCSVFRYPRGRHSAKPPEVRAAIEQMYPDFDEKSRLEIFARETIQNWSTYGFEADSKAA